MEETQSRTNTAVVGVDAGGSHTRAVVIGLDGVRLGEATAACGNPMTQSPHLAIAAITEATRSALAGARARHIRAVVIGMAGQGPSKRRSQMLDDFRFEWARLGLPCEPRIVPDAVVGFAAGTASPDGTVLIAGTGAVAVEIRSRKPGRVGDGYGWRLGDDGSGYWIGREAVRAALETIDGYRPVGPLARAAVIAMLPGAHMDDMARDPLRARANLIDVAYSYSAAEISRLAPLVMRACRAHDDTARAIMHRAARRLVMTLSVVRDAGDESPIVLGGGLLSNDTPVAAQVRAGLAQRWPLVPARVAHDGAAGAAWLAALSLPGIDDPIGLHRRLVPATTNGGART